MRREPGDRADNSLKKFCSKGKKDGSELLEGNVSVCQGEFQERGKR